MHKFLLVAAAVAVAMILPVMALAENDQSTPTRIPAWLVGRTRPLLGTGRVRC